MPLYSVLKLLHGGVVHGEKHYVNMLIQNKYYVVPVVNVDGLAYIEHKFVTTGVFSEKRKNMNLDDAALCPEEARGVDLNRNYGVTWDKAGGSSPDPCAENYRGPEPFSEPETRAIGRFILEHKSNIKFVYNFHSYGNMYLWPYNGQSPNNIKMKNPETLDVFQEIWDHSEFPKGTLSGNAWEALRYTSSGEQSDWILGHVGIPSICPEIGSDNIFSYDFTIPFRKVVWDVIQKNINWLEHTYDKIGTQLNVTDAHLSKDKKHLVLTVKNQGLSDQVLKHTYITINDNIKVPIKGLKARQSIDIKVDLPKHKESWSEYIFGHGSKK
jgi:hypothetical protein